MLGGSAASAKAVSCSIMNPLLTWEDRETRFGTTGELRTPPSMYELRKVRRCVPFALNCENKPCQETYLGACRITIIDM